MVNLNNILQGLSQSGAVSGFAGGLAGTAVAGVLSGKKGKKMAKSALKIGGLAAIGGLAWTAYQRFNQANQQGDAVGQSGAADTLEQRPAASHALETGEPVIASSQYWDDIDHQKFAAVIDDSDGAEAPGGLLLVRAMIAAATADGHIDRGEQQRIFEQSDQLGLAPAEKAMLFDELQRPISIPELVSQVTNPETAVEVYAASLVAIDPTRAEGQTYLRSLAVALDLPDPLTQSLHEQANLARQSKAA